MKKFGILITKYYKVLRFLRFSTNEEAEKAYKEYKEKGYGVVKVNIEKAYELCDTYIPET